MNKILISGSKVIQRILPFERGTYFPQINANYTINRIATQRSPEGIDHLEIFILKRNDPIEKAYNIYEPLLQNLFQAAFALNYFGGIIHMDKYNLELNFNSTNDSIVRAVLGFSDAPVS